MREGAPPSSHFAPRGVIGMRCECRQRTLKRCLSLRPPSAPGSPQVPLSYPVDCVPDLWSADPKPGVVSGSGCPSPVLSPAPPLSADHVSVSMELRFGAVVIAEAALSFYDCVAITLLRPSAP